MHLTRSALAAALAAAPLAFAQTFTDCNPLEADCPNDTGYEGTSFTSDFTSGSGANTSWSAAAGTSIVYSDKGAEFVIAKAGQAPTIQTDFYIFFGKVEVVMQASPGTGIVSSVVLESDDLDEIDWEWLGGDLTQVESNYFGKGNTSTYDRAIYYPVSSPQTTYHTYTIDWKPEALTFAIDGAVVRTLEYAAANGGQNYPQTPMRLKLGSWAAGAPGNAAGTIEWAGGETDFTAAPFNMYVKSVKVTNYNPAKEYKWTDKTGSYKSIKLINGDSSSASAGASSGTVSATTNVKAPTGFHTVKEVQQTDAVVSSTSKGSAASTTVASMQSSSSPTSSAVKDGSSGASASSTGSSKSSSSSTSSGSSDVGEASSSSSASASSSSSSHSSTSASGTSAQSASSASSTAQQFTGGASAAHGVATTFVVLSSIAFALVML